MAAPTPAFRQLIRQQGTSQKSLRAWRNAAGASTSLRLPRSPFGVSTSQEPPRARYLQTSCSAASERYGPTQSRRSVARPTLKSLPEKVDVCVGPVGRLAKVLPPRQAKKITTRVGTSYGGNHSFQWVEPPRTVLLVKKPHDAKASKAMGDIITHLHADYSNMNIVVERPVSEEFGQQFPFLITFDPSERQQLAAKVDFVVTLGGDGSILHVSSLFDQDAVPPVLSFSMGTLGFLLPFHVVSFKTALKDLIESRVSLLLRMRLQHSIHDSDGSRLVAPDGSTHEIHLMNEVALHRGRHPHMTVIDAFVNGQHLTEAISDGLIIATPTGSTAYSLSAGGPIVHPSVQSLVLTPICPRSLSFRTVLLPSDTTIQLKISKTSRSPAELSVDGRELNTLEPGQYLQVSMSPYPIPCVNRSSSILSSLEAPLGNVLELDSDSDRRRPLTPSLVDSKPRSPHAEDDKSASRKMVHSTHLEREEDNWVRDINTLLKFNASFSGRGLLGGHDSYEEVHGGADAGHGRKR